MTITNINIFATTQIKHQLANEIVDYKSNNPEAKGYLAIKDGKFVLVSKRSFLFNLFSIRQAAICLRKVEITTNNRFYVSFAEAFSGSTKLFGSETQQRLLESAKSIIRAESFLKKENIPYVLCSNLDEANKSENANKIVLWASTSDINKITICIPGKKPQRVGSERDIMDVISSANVNIEENEMLRLRQYTDEISLNLGKQSETGEDFKHPAVCLSRTVAGQFSYYIPNKEHKFTRTSSLQTIATAINQYGRDQIYVDMQEISENAQTRISSESAWDHLKKYAEEMEKYPVPKLSTFFNIRSNPNTRLTDFTDLNANLVKTQNGSKIIAASYPTKEALPTYLNMLREKSPSVVFVLTEDKEITGNLTPYFTAHLNSSQTDSSGSPIYSSVPENKSYRDIQTKSMHMPGKNTLEGLSVNQYELTISKNGAENRTIPVVHVTDWADFSSGHGAPALMQLALAVDKFGDTPLIHCRAGVGRTGTLIVARMMLEQRNSGQEITREGVINFIKAVRVQRNEMMVQTKEQLKALFDLVDLLNCRSSDLIVH